MPATPPRFIATQFAQFSHSYPIAALVAVVVLVLGIVLQLVLSLNKDDSTKVENSISLWIGSFGILGIATMGVLLVLLVYGFGSVFRSTQNLTENLATQLGHFNSSVADIASRFPNIKFSK